MKKPEPCPECHGKGWIDLAGHKSDEGRTCGLCNGSGSTPAGRTCGGCGGTGRIEVRTVEQQKCLKCMGTGRFPLAEDL
jgi:DnaJ-class molecular chaperone